MAHWASFAPMNRPAGSFLLLNLAREEKQLAKADLQQTKFFGERVIWRCQISLSEAITIQFVNFNVNLQFTYSNFPTNYRKYYNRI